ncbi:hypothetical protein [Chroococcidiopsis sp.]|uniref:hypothetical protein n=1 Tax=Chroococcidiopsis sp. TaxID=3088168 RepID=UPI003F3F4F77
MLLVLGKGGKYLRKREARGGEIRESYEQLWRLQCDCGNTIERLRGNFEKREGIKQYSCGCSKRGSQAINRNKLTNIAGKKFGTLTAIEPTGKRGAHNQPTWIMKCDCGLAVERSYKSIQNAKRIGYRIICGDKSKHPEKNLHYPPMPSPCPIEVCELLKEYLPLTRLKYKKVYAEVEDIKRDILLRTTWIITYRRWQGECISKGHEKAWIQKALRYAINEVKKRHCSFKNANRIVYNSGKLAGGCSPRQPFQEKRKTNKQIGIKMTNVTSENYPKIELLGKSLVSKKRLKFIRR